MGRWEHTVGGEIVAPPQRIWALWADADRWPAWNHGIQSARLDGPLALGAEATVRFKGSRRPRTFRVTELEEHRLFTDEARLPGAALRHVHRITPIEDGSWVEHELSLTGRLAGVWRMRIGKRVIEAAEEFIHAEARLVEPEPEPDR